MTLRFLALGDSYTIGEAVAPAERWPVHLTNLLRADGLDIAEPEVIATTGWTTGELAAGVDAASPQGPYDLVSLLIGVNNQYRGQSVKEYGSQFRALLRRAIDFAHGEPRRVLVLSIPDWGVTPFAEGQDRQRVAAEIDVFNEANRDETSRAGAHYVDVTSISRRAAHDSTLIASDSLHPSGEMYRLWAKLTLPEALAVLRS